MVWLEVDMLEKAAAREADSSTRGCREPDQQREFKQLQEITRHVTGHMTCSMHAVRPVLSAWVPSIGYRELLRSKPSAVSCTLQHKHQQVLYSHKSIYQELHSLTVSPNHHLTIKFAVLLHRQAHTPQISAQVVLRSIYCTSEGKRKASQLSYSEHSPTVSSNCQAWLASSPQSQRPASPHNVTTPIDLRSCALR